MKSVFYKYGTCNGMKARKHRFTKDVQFVLWKKGEQGHKKDFWINFDKSHYKNFKEDKG